MYSITTNNLTYRFNGKETVLSDINLQVPTGSIYGFLGPNGAGKTTTLRLLLGLLKKQDGEINIFNLPFEKNRIDILRKTGSLIESPSLYAHLSAKENLAILQKVYQCKPSRIEEVLKIVGLENTGKKSTGKFSLGMKQRLSIAIALMHEPELLILDEPTNGLDPNGIIEMRELLKQLNKDLGMTILVSSHLLAEIEKMVTHVGIINKGKLIFQGTMGELHEAQHQQSFMCFETGNVEKSKEVLKTNGIQFQQEGSQLHMPVLERELIASINKQLVEQDIKVYQISIVKNDLESIFIDLVK
ncbi:MAG: ATP-binding cassette domain-containing protein [Bacteroidetes bacterium]|nr:ATP-binding cassette domain-containing protein [Bacteroidota bacterium]MBL0278843.1 ATP-binding cassette domain-containing protein [Bacteroidota bacterium]